MPIVGRGYTLVRVPIVAFGTGDNTVATPASNQYCYLHSCYIPFTGTGKCRWKSGTGGGAVALSGNMTLPNGMALTSHEEGAVVTALGQPLNLNLDSGLTGDGWANVYYDSELH